MKLSFRMLLAATSLALLPLSANAADYDPPIVIDDLEEVVPVEVGSGWYLRGDIGYAFKRDFNEVTYGLRDPIVSLAPTSYDERRTTVNGSIGFGYHFNDYFRADVNLGYLSTDRAEINGVRIGGCSGVRSIETTTFNAAGEAIVPSTRTQNRETVNCDSSTEGTSRAFNGMVNGYIDLGTYVGVTPYVGAGVGVVYTPHKVRVGDSTCYGGSVVTSGSNFTQTDSFACDGIAAGGTSNAVTQEGYTAYDKEGYSLAYSLSAGFAYQMTQNLSLDVGYQYVAAPKAEYLTVGPAGFSLEEGLKYHQVKVGLRYDLW